MKLIDLYEKKKLGLRTIAELTADYKDGNFYCENRELDSLKGVPREIYGSFLCSRNKLESLDGAPKIIRGGYFACEHNKLESLKDIHKIIEEIEDEVIFAKWNPIKSHMLGVLYIKGLRAIHIDKEKVSNIINNFLPNHRGHRGVFECQCALQDANLDEYAQL